MTCNSLWYRKPDCSPNVWFHSFARTGHVSTLSSMGVYTLIRKTRQNEWRTASPFAIILQTQICCYSLATLSRSVLPLSHELPRWKSNTFKPIPAFALIVKNCSGSLFRSFSLFVLKSRRYYAFPWFCASFFKHLICM